MYPSTLTRHRPQSALQRRLRDATMGLLLAPVLAWLVSVPVGTCGSESSGVLTLACSGPPSRRGPRERTLWCRRRSIAEVVEDADAWSPSHQPALGSANGPAQARRRHDGRGNRR